MVVPSAACRTWVIRKCRLLPLSLLKRRPVVEVQMCAAAEVRSCRCPNGGRRRTEEGVAHCQRNGGGTGKRMMQLLLRECCVGGHQYVVLRSASGSPIWRRCLSPRLHWLLVETQPRVVFITGVALVAGLRRPFCAGVTNMWEFRAAGCCHTRFYTSSRRNLCIWLVPR
jgi:hypothetical protein